LVEDDFDAAHRVVHSLVAAQLALDDLEFLDDVGEVPSVAGGEVVEHAHGVALLEQSPREVRADEAAAAGDEDAPAHTTAVTW
jgi:hypothetical protein